MVFPSFSEFFAELHGVTPYAWQENLVAQLADVHRWPSLIPIPTGMGKTSTIDAAVYDLARQAHQIAANQMKKRTAPMRIFHVVDRRIIVDSAAEHAKAIADAINNAPDDGVLAPVRDALRELTGPGDNTAIKVAGIHGMSEDDRDWWRATGCTIVSLTSYQFVSRLVMRGYGIAEGMRPISAALCGIDSLVLFDEPHLSPQAIQTITDAIVLQRRAEENLQLGESQLVLLGATIPQGIRRIVEQGNTASGGVAALPTPIDTARGEATPIEQTRLNAKRTLRCRWISTQSDSNVAKDLVKQAVTMWSHGLERVVVFVNTVAAAQNVYELLLAEKAKLKKPAAAAESIQLTTSRFRAVDRDTANWGEGPITIVSTQTLEVGADISFDGLVTEPSPWDSLIQRLGRLNRDGMSQWGTAVLVAAWDQTKQTTKLRAATTHVYPVSTVRTCVEYLHLLSEQSDGPIDMSLGGLAAIRAHDSFPEMELGGSMPRLATLHSGMIPLISQTRPTPVPDFPLVSYLAGPESERRHDMPVAWRADLSVFDVKLESKRGSTKRSKRSRQSGSFIYSEETVDVSPDALSAFLTQKAPEASALSDMDVPFADLSTERQTVDQEILKRVRGWNPRSRSWETPQSRTDIRQWINRVSQVVLGTDLGGYSAELGWTGRRSSNNVEDVSLIAAARSLRHSLEHPPFQDDQITASFVLSEKTIEGAHAWLGRHANAGGAAVVNLPNTLWEEIGNAEDYLADDAVIAALRESVAAIADATSPGVKKTVRQSRAPIVFMDHCAVVPVVVPLVRRTENTTVMLRDHCEQVGAYAYMDAMHAGMPQHIRTVLAYSGVLHDSGKAAAEFQQRLRGRSTTRGEALIAKPLPGVIIGNGPGRDWLRHEALSSVIAQTALPGTLDQWSRALAIHLIASHHGCARAVLPPRGRRASQRLELTGASQYSALATAFGPWGLAYLEAVLRLADWHASTEPRSARATQSPDLLETGVLNAYDEELFVQIAAEDAQRVRGDVEPRGGTESGVSTGVGGAVGNKKANPKGTDSLDVNRYRLSGLAASPLTGWYAAVGLLWAAHMVGDAAATLHWESVAPEERTTEPTIPVLRTRLELDELVHTVLFAPEWDEAKQLWEAVGLEGKGLCRKNQKITPGDRVRELLLLAEDSRNQLILGLVSDSGARDSKGQLQLPLPVLANNSNYLGVAYDHLGVKEIHVEAEGRHAGETATVEALLDINAGYESVTCDGGMDRNRASKSDVNGTWRQRVSRAALAPLAVMGMAAFGCGQPQGAGRMEDILELPLPAQPMLYPELRAATIIGCALDRRNTWVNFAGGWVYRASRQPDGKSENYWVGGPTRRSSLLKASMAHASSVAQVSAAE